VMLYQMLTGVLPFRGESMAELMYKIANEEAPDPRIVRKELPERLAQLVARSLAKKPELRYQDGDEFARDLRAVIAAMGGEVAPTPSADAAAALPAASANQPTVAFQAPAVSAHGDKTVVMAAGNALAPPAALPGYDAAEKEGAAPGAPFEKTSVMNTSGAPQRPQAGGGKTGQEP
jgi:eukaryotic-like serine/threonine-protein kinase